jgi:hypothetical protein
MNISLFHEKRIILNKVPLDTIEFSFIVFNFCKVLRFGSNFNIFHSVSNGGISPDQKWWQTVSEIEISCSQWEGSACTESALIFFHLCWGAGEGFFFLFPLFPSSSHQVPKMFPRFSMCSSRVFPITTIEDVGDCIVHRRIICNFWRV